MPSSTNTNPTKSPRRHLVQALTLVNDIINRRKRDGLELSDEELELLGKAYKNAPRPPPSSSSTSNNNNTTENNIGVLMPLVTQSPQATTVKISTTPEEENNNNNKNETSTPEKQKDQQQQQDGDKTSGTAAVSPSPSSGAAAAGSPGSRQASRTRGLSSRRPVKDQVSELLASSSEDTTKLINFAVSCSALTSSPVQLIQLLVNFVTKFVPNGKPVSMMIFDGDYTVDPLNGTLLANSARFLNLFSENSNDFVFDATAAAYFLPVSAEGELFGFVQISNMHAENELDPEHAKLLIASTCVAALALRTSWQLEDLEWSHRKQAVLLKVGTSLTSDAFSKEQDVISRIQSRAKDLGDAQAAYYFRVDEETREIKYFHKGELFPETVVFANTSMNVSPNDTQNNMMMNNSASGSQQYQHFMINSAHMEDDNEDDENAAITDAVRLAMQTAERVVKTAGVVQLQQAPGDDDKYVDVVGTRSRYAGGKRFSTVAGASSPTGSVNPGSSPTTANNNTTDQQHKQDRFAAGSAGSALNLRRGARAVNVDLPFSLAKTRSVRSVLGIPILNEDNQVKGVLILTNKNHRRVARIDVPQNFEQRDVEILLALASVASISIANCKAANRIHQEKRRRDAILSVVAHLNETDIRNVDEICRYVMHGARKLVNADRSTLFLIDEEHDELYSAVADSVGKVIRFPVGKGIAGRVALTGQAEMIRDAYADDRFNKEVDKQTGYRTLSILTVPVQSKGDTLAVAQLVNKLDTKTNEPVPFSQDDLDMLRTFSLFAGIAISNSQLLEFTVKAGKEAMALTNFDTDQATTPGLRRITTSTSMQLAAQALPVISATEIEHVKDGLDVVKRLRDSDPVRFDPTSKSFDLFALREEAPDSAVARDYASAVIVYLMESAGFDHIFKFDLDTLITFVIQCRQMYRYVPYHNFFHAVDVTQTIYTFLFSGGGRQFISELEAFVLLVTGLTHDLDHMGLNNSYHLKSDSPLGILSSVSGNNSVLEVHHCNLAIQILSAPESGIFTGLSKHEQTVAYREMLSCILATDMARHGDTLKQFSDICQEGFDKEKDEHRLVAMQMMMKAADISNVTKPFHISRQWATAVTEEFYLQGDKERAKGMQVLPMNDRQLGTELAKGQLGFINFVAKKFFTTMKDGLFKELGWAVAALEDNVENWQEVLNKHEAEQEQEEKKN